jgi:hypothetical protein
MFQQTATGNSLTGQMAQAAAEIASPLAAEITVADFRGAGMPEVDRGPGIEAEVAGTEIGVMPQTARFLDAETSFKDLVMSMAA